VTPQLRVLIADDDHLMRAGLRAVLSTDDTIEVVAEAADGQHAVAHTCRHRPDLVLMDIRMPDMDGITATRKISAVLPHTRVLILTTFEDDDYIFGALHAGASGFLLKRMQPEHLIDAIHTVAAGEALLSPSVTRTVIRHVAGQPRPNPRSRRELDQLTQRERDVLALIARGMSNSEIAAELVVEESTIKTHVKRILAKLGLRDRVQAVILAYQAGLVGQPASP
jgi:DNA-binding NarL/FixJ family response regulator